MSKETAVKQLLDAQAQSVTDLKNTVKRILKDSGILNEPQYRLEWRAHGFRLVLDAYIDALESILKNIHGSLFLSPHILLTNIGYKGQQVAMSLEIDNTVTAEELAAVGITQLRLSANDTSNVKALVNVLRPYILPQTTSSSDDTPVKMEEDQNLLSDRTEWI